MRPTTEHVEAAVAALSVIAFLVLTVVVATGRADAWDHEVLQRFRPHDVWGTVQVKADLVVEGLRPTHALVLLLLVTVWVCVRRHDWRPALLATSAGVAAVVATYAGKVIVARPDVHGQLAEGSYPSGHTLSIAVAVGIGALLLLGRRRSGWALAATALAATLMGVALLLQAAHWATDVVAGALIALAVVAAASALSRAAVADDGRAAQGGER
jgi:membrane-associated phospholipid phosphatase